MLKILKVTKVKVHTNRSSSLPQKTWLLKHLVSSLAFNQRRLGVQEGAAIKRHEKDNKCFRQKGDTVKNTNLFW